MSIERPSAAFIHSTRPTVLQFANSIAVGALPMWPTHTPHPPLPQLAPLPAAAMSAVPAPAAHSSSSALWGGFPTMAPPVASASLMDFPSALALSRESAPHLHTQKHHSVSVSSFSALQAELAASKPLNHFPGFPAPQPIAAPILTAFSSHTHNSITLLSSPLHSTALPLEISSTSSMSECGESGGNHSIHNRSVTSSNPLSSPSAAAPAPPATSSRAFACIHAALNGSTAWLQNSSAAITLMDAAHKSSKQSRNPVPLAFPSSIAPSPEQRKASA